MSQTKAALARLIKKARTQPENDFQAALVLRLRHLGYYVVEFGKPGAHRELGGILPEGWPDILIIHKGGAHTYLELKAYGGRLSEAQERCHAILTTLGCYVATAWDFDCAVLCVEKREAVSTLEKIANGEKTVSRS